jgi:hypothetical protein
MRAGWAMAIGTMMGVGCAPSAIKITSRRAPELGEPIRALFVLSQVGAHEEASPDDFEHTLVETGKACGVRIGVGRSSKLELDTHAQDKQIKDFGAAYVLAFDLTGDAVNSRSDKVQLASYDARLFRADPEAETPPHTLLWRADVQIRRGSDYRNDQGSLLASALLQQLNADKMIAHCERLDKRSEIPAPLPE